MNEAIWYQYLWLFFCYSFFGWAAECFAAARMRKKFVNRGVLAGPVCSVYGIAAVGITIYGRELREHVVFLFIGCMVISGFVEWMSGHALEHIYHRKWWDYSDQKWNLDGYISLKYVLLWGVLGIVCLWFVNPVLIAVWNLVPLMLRRVLLWGAVWLMVIDAVWSHCALLGLPQKLPKTENVQNRLIAVTLKLSSWISGNTQARIEKSFPGVLSGKKEKVKPLVFAEGCGFYKKFWLFFIGAFMGDIVETIFCRVTMGYWMSRSSLVWGPFSVVWGLAVAMITQILYNYRKKSDSFLFLFGTALGGVYEYLCSVFTEIVFGKIFWDYSGIPFNIGGRINLLYCFFWGFATVIWLKLCYPCLSGLIERLPMKAGKILTWILLVFMAVNMSVSALALARSDARESGKPADNPVAEWLDVHYNDEVLKKIYPKAKTKKIVPLEVEKN